MIPPASKPANSTTFNRFPKRLILITLLINIVLLVMLSWNSWQFYKDLSINEPKIIRLQELIGIIKTTDEVLTMSARMAAATGDLKWESRYLSFEIKLDEAIQEAMQIFPDKSLRDAMAKTDESNRALVIMEKHSFELVRNHQKDKAFGLLFSDQYEKQKKIYSNGTIDALKYIGKYINDSIYRQNKRAFISFISVIVVLIISIVASMFVLRLAGSYVEQRIKSDEEREQLIAELQKALAEIKTLRGILPICSVCKKIHDDTGSWSQMEAYISKHSEAEFSHGLCPECAKKAFKEVEEWKKKLK